MGLKKRNQRSAEFSMASLTDMIFLLLIFFMLTSNFVGIRPFDLPESDSKTVASNSIIITVEKNGTYTFNNKETGFSGLERSARRELSVMDNKDNATLTIVAETGVPFEKVTQLMEIAAKLRIKAIIATQPKS
ncbi:MAG: biopolymer transporter ExbD [Saprospiraceae bacterium]|nr:biopolymer transporter ExbD [Saprospiraceae bacterium]